MTDFKSGWPFESPLIWRVVAWGVMAGVTGYAGHTLSRQLAAGLVVAAAATALQFATDSRERVRQLAVLTASIGGLAGTLLAPNGLGEVVTFVAASRIPGAFTPRDTRVITVLDTLAVGTVIGIISHSLIGALAGLGIPLLVLRANEHEELIHERDRAQALLAEVRAGREAEAEAAALKERGRIARDLHDVLAHTLAGLSVQLQGTRAIAAKEQVSPAVLEPLAKAALLAQTGLSEARAAVGALRAPIGLGIAEIPALVERHPGPTTLEVIGAPGEVTHAAGHAVYRAVQEALTNAARYAPGAQVAVELIWKPDALTAQVRDTGPAPNRTVVAEQGTGLGLAGMQERVTSVGGTVQVGPGPSGGWCVEVTVPTS